MMNESEWTTKDGRKIRVCDMSDSHLVNTIKMLWKHARSRKIKKDVFLLACEPPTAEGAALAFEQGCDEQFSLEWEDEVDPIFHEMMDEADKRGIKLDLPDMDGVDAGLTAKRVLEIDRRRKLRRLRAVEEEERRLRKELDEIMKDGELF